MCTHPVGCVPAHTYNYREQREHTRSENEQNPPLKPLPESPNLSLRAIDVTTTFGKQNPPSKPLPESPNLSLRASLETRVFKARVGT